MKHSYFSLVIKSIFVISKSINNVLRSAVIGTVKIHSMKIQKVS